MIKSMKKFISMVLTVTMLMGLVCVPTFAATIAEGTNGNTIYLSLVCTTDSDGTTPATSVSKDDKFYLWINFAGNSSEKFETTTDEEAIKGVWSYNLLIGYDEEKMLFAKNGVPKLAYQVYNPTYSTGLAYAAWANEGGIYRFNDETEMFESYSSGSLFRVTVTALQDLTEEDLKSITFVNEYSANNMRTNMLDGNEKEFTVIQTPALSVGTVSGDIYSDTTADDIKAMISSIAFIDNAGTSTTYTAADAEWNNLSVELPAAGLVVGENTLTALYDGYKCDFEVTVLDRIEKIEVTTPPAKTVYTAFEKFDKTGMVVTATYESGDTKDVTADCVVDTDTELKVADTSWDITYGDKTATLAITVNPKPITKPEASGSFEYNGLEQEFTYATPVDTDYVSISGDVNGKDAGKYYATASLKDKSNTVWADDNETADVRLSWTIEKTTITSGITSMTKKYTTTYAELPTVAEVTGKNNETVSADIKWYADAACTQVAPTGNQIAESYTGENQKVTLYYKASGMSNYEDYMGSVEVNVTDKDAGTIEWTRKLDGWTFANKTATGTYSVEGYTVLADLFTVKSIDGTVLSASTNTVTVKNSNGVTVDKITDVGTYIITVEYEDKDNKAKEEFTAVVNPKSIEGLVVSLKVGSDSEVQTSITNPLVCTYTGSEIAPVVAGLAGVEAGNYVVDTGALGKTNVSDDVYTIAVNGIGNYTGTAYGYWKITPAEISIIGAVIEDKIFNGLTDDAVVNNVEFNSFEPLEKGIDYTVTSAVYADKNVGDAVGVEVKVALTDSPKAKNYTLKSSTINTTGKITKANAPVLSAPVTQTLLSSSVVNGPKDYTFDLASIIKDIPDDAGNVTYTVKTEGTYAKGAVIEASALKFNVAEPQTAGETDSVDITVSTTNYEDKDVTVTFEFKNKTSVEVTLDDVTVTYGDEYTVAGKYANQPQSGYKWTYTYQDIESAMSAVLTEKPVKAGTYKVTARYEDDTPDSENPEIPGHVGTATATLTINKKSLDILDGDVTVSKVYDGTPDAGALSGTLALSGKVGEDDVYIDMNSATVGAYSNSKVGTYTVEIGGFVLGGADKDNYSINPTYNFENAEITKQLQSNLTINGGDQTITKEYGSGIVEIVVGGGNGEGAYNLISSDNSILKLSADNATTWKAEILKAGNVTLTASKAGDDNYEAATELVINFKITPKLIAEGDFTIDIDDKTYTSNAIEPAVSSETMVASTDYDVVYSNNVNVGEATITIKGKDNYQGEVSKTFAIIAKELNETDFTVSGLMENGYTYDGTELKPAFDVKWGNVLLVVDTDYEVAYTDNVNAGTATITITGKGNYSGNLAEQFIINPADYVGVVTISADTEVVGVDTILTANAPAGGTLAYQWNRDGVAIENATSGTYTVTTDDVDADINVTVSSTGNYAGSVESSTVSVGKIALTGSVEITVATELTANIVGAPEAENYDIVWLRNGEVITGATETTYTVTGDDKGCVISVKIVAKGETYTGEIASTNNVSVPAEAPCFETNPVVTPGNGSATVGLNAKANGSEIINYQILVDGTVVATVPGGQTKYTVTGLVNGTTYEIKVVAINTVGSTESNEVTVTPSAPANIGGGGGGGGVASYVISVASTTGGTVVPDVKRAAKGKLVTVKVNASEGYKLSDLSVVDKDGNEIEAYKDGLIYTFTMPATTVTITPVFTKLSDNTQDNSQTEAKGFADVKSGAYYYDAVEWAVEKGVTNGTSANAFSPDAECTRAQMVTFLWRAAGSPKAESTKGLFTDIVEGSYYYDAVIWAVENGITSGITETTFGPDARVDRAQTVTFLWRLANSPATEGGNPFGDVESDAYYGNAVVWAVGESITNGVTSTSFGPADACTRAQIVTFLHRYFVK